MGGIPGRDTAREAVTPVGEAGAAGAAVPAPSATAAPLDTIGARGAPPPRELTMTTQHKGREIEIRPGSYGPPSFRVGDGPWMNGNAGESPGALLKRVKAIVDDFDAQPIRHDRYRWWYRPGDVETCRRSAGGLSPHHKGVAMACTAPQCVKAARIEQQRAKRRTGLTATIVSRVLTQAGQQRAELRSDGTAKGSRRKGRTGTVASRCFGAGTRRRPAKGCPRIFARARACSWSRVTRSGAPPRGSALWVFPKGSEPAVGLELYDAAEEEEFEQEIAEAEAEESASFSPAAVVPGQLGFWDALRQAEPDDLTIF